MDEAPLSSFQPSASRLSSLTTRAGPKHAKSLVLQLDFIILACLSRDRSSFESLFDYRQTSSAAVADKRTLQFLCIFALQLEGAAGLPAIDRRTSSSYHTHSHLWSKLRIEAVHIQ